MAFLRPNCSVSIFSLLRHRHQFEHAEFGDHYRSYRGLWEEVQQLWSNLQMLNFPKSKCPATLFQSAARISRYFHNLNLRGIERTKCLEMRVESAILASESMLIYWQLLILTVFRFEAWRGVTKLGYSIVIMENRGWNGWIQSWNDELSSNVLQTRRNVDYCPGARKQPWIAVLSESDVKLFWCQSIITFISVCYSEMNQRGVEHAEWHLRLIYCEVQIAMNCLLNSVSWADDHFIKINVTFMYPTFGHILI